MSSGLLTGKNVIPLPFFNGNLNNCTLDSSEFLTASRAFPRCSMMVPSFFSLQEIFPILCVPAIQNLRDCGLDHRYVPLPGSVFFNSAYHPGGSINPFFGRNLNFNSADVKISCDMNLKNLCPGIVA